VVLLLESDLVFWSLAIDERGEHDDLCGLDRRSVIPYFHRRIELYCSSLPCMCLFPTSPYEEALTRAFYSSRSDSYIETQCSTCSLIVVKILYNIYGHNG
jgi:hypothetical protein